MIEWIVKFLLIFNWAVIWYFLALNGAYLMLFGISLFEVLRFVRRTFFSDYREIMQSEMTWPITILVAAHNEEKTIVETVRSLMMLNYGEFEIVVINDGSTDDTLNKLIEAFDLRRADRAYKVSIPTEEVLGLYTSLERRVLTVIDKEKGGKPDALNAGINVSRYPLFCSVDADSVLEDNALLRIVKPFMNHPDETVASGGIVRVVNGCSVKDGRVTEISLPNRALPIFQVIEYLRAFLTGRVGWSVLRSLMIISGAFGLYKKSEVIALGGFHRETETEDLDLIVRLHRQLRKDKRKYRIEFVPDPVCWTEVPESLSVLMKQRNRWHRGLVRTLWRNRGMTFNPRYGAVGMFAFPFFVAFEMLGPFVEILGYLLIIVGFILGIINTKFLILFAVVAFVLGILLSLAAVLLEELSFRRYPSWSDLLKLMVFGVLENLGFRQLLSLFKAKAFFDVVIGRRGWGDMERRGFGSDDSQPEEEAA